MEIKDILDDKLLKTFGDDYIKILIQNLMRYKSSGTLIKSLSSELKQTAEHIDILIKSEDYINILQDGRKKGTYPNIRELAKWTRLKNISPKAIFPIAKSIYKYGIKPHHVISDSIQQFDINNALTSKYEDVMVKNIENKLIQDINNNIK